MKKRIQALVFAAFMLMMAGCGQAQENNSSSGSGDVSAKTEAVQKAESLDVGNDMFTFYELTEQVGAAEEEVIEFLGATEKNESYSIELFGEAVEISLDTKEDTVQSIRLIFPKTNAESLKNAISEQLGKNGEDSGKKTVWESSATVTLSAETQGCVVTLEK